MALILIPPTDAANSAVNDSGFEVVEGSNVQSALDSVDQAILKEASTGILTGGECTGVGTATLNIAAGEGAILDNTDTDAQTYTKINWDATTATPASGISFYYVDTDGVVKSTATQPEHSQYRLKIWLARVLVVSGVIAEIIPIVMPMQQAAAQIWDVFRAYGLVKNGLQVQASGANLKIKHSSGELYFAGVNFWNDSLNPHETQFNVFDSASTAFQMVKQDGLIAVDVNDLPVGSYDNAGVVTSIPGSSSRASIFSVYKLPNGAVRVLYGQQYYDNLTQAFNAAGSYSPSVPTYLSDTGILLGYIVATKSATDLTNTAQAKFILSNRFGGIGGAVATAAEVNWGDIAGTLSNQSDLQTAIDTAKMYGLNTQFFGDGSDGNVTISSGTTTLTRDMYYNNLTVSGTAIIDTARYRIFVKGTLNLDNAPADAIRPFGNFNQSNSASGATGGSSAGISSASTVGGNSTPVAGVNGTTGAGSAGNNASSTSSQFNGGLPGSSGSGGAPALAAGGASGNTSNAINADNPIYRPEINLLRAASTINGGCSASSGGAGTGDGSNAGGGSGASGRGGAIIAIFANTISRGSSTGAGAITARGTTGGNGGNGAGGNAGGGGGSGGGGGGWVYIVYANLTGSTATNCINVSGGNGGNGGNGAGTGRGGQGGQGGAGGRVTLINVTTGVVTENNGSVDTLPAAATTPTTSSGSTGTTGTQVLVSL